VACAQLNINFIAVNPSEKETREIDVEYFLPKELEPEDILDPGPLKLEYNIEKNAIYAKGKISFLPKESKTFRIQVRDVWRIDPGEINLLKEQLKRSIATIGQDDPAYSSALYAQNKLNEEMDYILKQQDDFVGNIERRIENYRANISVLQKIRDRVYSMDFLKFEAKGIQELDQVEGTVKMVVEVKNPFIDKDLAVTHKHYLPKEIRGEDVLEKADFDLRFDEKRGQMYLTKEENFQPGEAKQYDVILKDVWHFPDVKLQDLDDRSQIAMLELDETDYQESAHHLYENIKTRLAQIKESKALDTSIERHVGLFRLNTRRFNEAWGDFKRIEEMISIVRAKKLEALEKKKVKNVLERLKALRGLQQLSEALFKRRLSMNVTWKIIFFTMGFVGFFTAFHFFIWARRSKIMGEELAPKSGEGVTIVPKPGEKKEEEQ
jgi:hypothetical protein